jgi:hypothetical protein
MPEPLDPADSPTPPAVHERIAARVKAGAMVQVRPIFANVGIAAHVAGQAA